MNITKNNWINVLRFMNKIISNTKLNNFMKRIHSDKTFQNKTKKYIFTNQDEEIVVSKSLIKFINEVDDYIADWENK